MRGKFSYDDMIACVRREIALRKRVYPKWVDQERMNQEKADREIECMEAVLLEIEEKAGRRML